MTSVLASLTQDMQTGSVRIRNVPKKVVILMVVIAAVFVVAAYARWPAGDPPAESANRIVVLKHEHEMILFRDSLALKTYRVSLGRNPFGPKTRAGDHRTPEGYYAIDWRNPKSRFYLPLRISYPNLRDPENARQKGVQPGGNIMIHGIENGLGWVGRFQRWYDWTDGCIAVTDAEMDQIWKAVADGKPIEIRP